MSNDIAERRNAPRYPLILFAEVTELSSGTRISARTSDLSRTGCYLDMLKPFPSGSNVRVKLSFKDETVELNATTRYVSPGMGMGVQFESQLPSKQLAILVRWLESAAKQPV